MIIETPGMTLVRVKGQPGEVRASLVRGPLIELSTDDWTFLTPEAVLELAADLTTLVGRARAEEAKRRLDKETR